MKKTLSILLILIAMMACKTSAVDYTEQDINSIAFYDYDGSEISLQNLTEQWNERLQRNENTNAKITNMEIRIITDVVTQEKELVLIGHTNREYVTTATQLEKFKNGLQLSDRIVTCKNCKNELNVQLMNGDWSCRSEGQVGIDCTKIATLRN